MFCCGGGCVKVNEVDEALVGSIWCHWFSSQPEEILGSVALTSKDRKDERMRGGKVERGREFETLKAAGVELILKICEGCT